VQWKSAQSVASCRSVETPLAFPHFPQARLPLNRGGSFLLYHGGSLLRCQNDGGANWHQTLLRQMAVEIPRVRPAVISSGSYELLDEYRGFRHVVRNVYTFHFDPARIKRLVEQAPVVFNRVRPELVAFADFLREQAETQGE